MGRSQSFNERVILAVNESKSPLVPSAVLHRVPFGNFESDLSSRKRSGYGLRDFCILPTPAKCKILCIGAEEERRGEEIDGGGILKTRNWRNDGFAEAERREVHSLTRRLCEGNYAKEEKRRRGRGRVGLQVSKLEGLTAATVCESYIYCFAFTWRCNRGRCEEKPEAKNGARKGEVASSVLRFPSTDTLIFCTAD